MDDSELDDYKLNDEDGAKYSFIFWLIVICLLSLTIEDEEKEVDVCSEVKIQQNSE